MTSCNRFLKASSLLSTTSPLFHGFSTTLGQFWPVSSRTLSCHSSQTVTAMRSWSSAWEVFLRKIPRELKILIFLLLSLYFFAEPLFEFSLCLNLSLYTFMFFCTSQSCAQWILSKKLYWYCKKIPVSFFIITNFISKNKWMSEDFFFQLLKEQKPNYTDKKCVLRVYWPPGFLTTTKKKATSLWLRW